MVGDSPQVAAIPGVLEELRNSTPIVGAVIWDLQELVKLGVPPPPLPKVAGQGDVVQPRHPLDGEEAASGPRTQQVSSQQGGGSAGCVEALPPLTAPALEVKRRGPPPTHATPLLLPFVPCFKAG